LSKAAANLDPQSYILDLASFEMEMLPRRQPISERIKLISATPDSIQHQPNH
jgi:hypothetical protein